MHSFLSGTPYWAPVGLAACGRGDDGSGRRDPRIGVFIALLNQPSRDALHCSQIGVHHCQPSILKTPEQDERILNTLLLQYLSPACPRISSSSSLLISFPESCASSSQPINYVGIRHSAYILFHLLRFPCVGTVLVARSLCCLLYSLPT